MSEFSAEDVLAELKRVSDALRLNYPEKTLRSFFEEIPPDTYVYVTDITPSHTNTAYFVTPQITLHCDSEECGGPRVFKADSNLSSSSAWQFTYVKYSCRNCDKRLVRFSIGYSIAKIPGTAGGIQGTFIKLGQLPSFGPYTPARVTTLIGPDRELFLQGRRAENRGMGIGAFAYYRRVVENQKNRIIGEIAKVARVIGSTPEIDALFAAALEEDQFTKSLDMVKDVIPQTLMIRGQNPLKLLHTALSKGLHDEEMSDALCLQRAQSIRTILIELTERSAQALKDDKEILSALSTLLTPPSAPTVAESAEKL